MRAGAVRQEKINKSGADPAAIPSDSISRSPADSLWWRTPRVSVAAAGCCAAAAVPLVTDSCRYRAVTRHLLAAAGPFNPAG